MSIKSKSRVLLINFCALIIAALSFLSVRYNYSELPNKIPIHYDLSGNADNFGNKSDINNLLIISAICFAVLAAFSMFPKYTYFSISSTKRKSQLLNLISIFFSIINVLTQSMVLVIVLDIIYVSQTRMDLQMIWLLYLLVGLICISIIYFMISLIKINTKK